MRCNFNIYEVFGSSSPHVLSLSFVSMLMLKERDLITTVLEYGATRVSIFWFCAGRVHVNHEVAQNQAAG